MSLNEQQRKFYETALSQTKQEILDLDRPERGRGLALPLQHA